MAYQFRRGESVEQGVHRIACEQIDKAIDEAQNMEDREEAVHQVRKRCKKLRGLIRLVRPVFDGYAGENAAFRDAARDLSDLRDMTAIIETFDELVEHFADEIDDQAMRDVRQSLSRQRGDGFAMTRRIDERLTRFVEQMHDARRRCEDWKLKDSDFDAIRGGLTRTYKRGRKAMDAAYDAPTAEAFHEWRKRVKYHWYHLRLLRRVWRPVTKGYRKQASELADLLGDDHDLAVLIAMGQTDAEAFGGAMHAEVVLALARRRRTELEQQARPLGRKLYCETPKALGRRHEAWWQAWQA